LILRGEAVPDRADTVGGRKVSVGNLDLPPGYSAERGEAGIYLVDPDGRRMMRLPGDVAFTDPCETVNPPRGEGTKLRVSLSRGGRVAEGEETNRKRSGNVGDLVISTQADKSRRRFGVPPTSRSLVHRKDAPWTDLF